MFDFGNLFFLLKVIQLD